MSENGGKTGGGGGGYPSYISGKPPVPDGEGGFRWGPVEDDPECAPFPPGGNIETACDWLRMGLLVARKCWNGEILLLSTGDDGENGTIMLTDKADGPLKAWNPTIEDLSSDDWVVV